MIRIVDGEIVRSVIIAHGERHYYDWTDKQAFMKRKGCKPWEKARASRIEDIYDDDKSRGDVLKGLSPLIRCLAKSAAFRIKNSGFRCDEFELESILFLEVNRLLDAGKYRPSETRKPFYFYVESALLWKIGEFMKDMNERTARNKQTHFEMSAGTLPDDMESEDNDAPGQVSDTFDLERESIARMTVDNMLQDNRLTEDERTLLIAMKDAPDASNLELSKMCGFSCDKKVKRLKLKIGVKLRDHVQL
mgnify:CR=1 FL=1